MSKVSYLLGAGASYGERIPRMFEGEQEKDARGNGLNDISRGLPVMNEMKDAIQQLLNEIEEEKRFSVSPSRQQLKSELLELYKACARNPTIDTYSKTLYTNEVSKTCPDLKPYYALKAQLSIAFMLWQKLDKYDQRYLSFFNDIINPHTGKLPPLTILSWNYDIQLEMAFDNYIKYGNSLTKSWDELNVYCKTYPVSKIPLVKSYDNTLPFALLKLNGSALFYENERNDRTLRFTIQDPFWNINDENEKYDLLYDYFMHCEVGNSQPPKYVNGLSYIWETDRQEELKKCIVERVRDTEELVIIGYSFPNVNSEIDRHIFNSMPNLKHIYIQDGNANMIKKKIEDTFNFLQKSIPFIEPLEEISNFYIPNSLI